MALKGDIPVWEMVKEAVESLCGEATQKAIKTYINAHYKNVNETTIHLQTLMCSVNSPTRINLSTCQHERKCYLGESKYDFLFIQNNKVSLYNPLIHGKWKIIKNNGKYQIAQEEHDCFLQVDADEVGKCQDIMYNALTTMGSVRKTVVNWHGSSGEEDIWWFAKYGFWWARETSDESTSDGNAPRLVYWNGFGIADKTAAFNPAKVSVTCDINMSTGKANNAQGMFVKDDKDKYYLAHTGKFTRQKTKMSLEDHVTWKKIDICGQDKSVFVISALNDPKLAQNLRTFIRAMHVAKDSGESEMKEFAFVEKDFDSLTGKKEDAQYIRDRFKDLENVLQSKLEDSDTYHTYTAHPMAPPKSGQPVWKNHMWLGIIPEYAFVNKAQDSIQFQVSLFKRDSFSCMIWISYVAPDRLNTVKSVISDRADEFARLLRDLPDEGYAITARSHTTKATHRFSASDASETEIDKIAEVMNHNKVDFGIVRSWDKMEAISKETGIVDEIVGTITSLMPTYRFLNGHDLGQAESYTIDNIMDEGCFLDKATLAQMIRTLEDEKNIILQGPPGTGKTWLAKRLAFALTGHRPDACVRPFQFHPNLSYEDFVRGWRPSSTDENSTGSLTLVDGPFLRSIQDAIRDPGRKFVIVIEEINRGNPANIFGEMLTLLEADKRTELEALPLSYTNKEGERVHIPENLYVIGTMNVADRSIAMVDLALRRRFGFYSLEPLFNKRWEDWMRKSKIPERLINTIRTNLTALNNTISKDHLLGPHFRIGHSYVTPSGKRRVINDPREWFESIVKNKIGPQLEEYWVTNPERVREETDKLLNGLV